MLQKKKKHISNWLKIPDHPYRVSIVGGLGCGKAISLFNLFNLISYQPDIDKIYLYPKDPFETKYQLLISKRETTGLEHFNDSKAFIEYSIDMDKIYKNIEEYNPNKKRKILIAFDDMIAVEPKPIVTELFIRGTKFPLFLLHNLTLLYTKKISY